LVRFVFIIEQKKLKKKIMATTITVKKLSSSPTSKFESLSITEKRKCVNNECTHQATVKCLVCDQSLYCGKDCYAKCESRHGLQCLKTFASKNDNFRKVIFTSEIDNSQLVLMSLKPGEDIGFEIHNDSDQFFFTVNGKIEIQKKVAKESTTVIQTAIINENQPITEDNWIRQGTEHNVVNISKTNGGDDAKLITFYTKAQHKDGVIHKTKAEAEEDEKKELLPKKFSNSSSGGGKTQMQKLMMLSATYNMK